MIDCLIERVLLYLTGGRFGANEMPAPPETTLLQLIWAGLHDKTLIMLIIASVVSLIFGIWENPSHGWIEGTAILLAVVLVVMVASLNVIIYHHHHHHDTRAELMHFYRIITKRSNLESSTKRKIIDKSKS
jgi:magnesium-transporting ATPase (P-type)